MDTKLVTTNIRLSQWNAIIQDRLQSGMTVDEYCEEKGIARHKYYYWLRKLKEAAIEANPHKFAELVPVETTSVQEPALTTTSESDFSPQMIIRMNNIEIALNNHTSKELLAMVLEVTGNA